jgi:membrane protease YdiL (CAAX protease family)
MTQKVPVRLTSAPECFRAHLSYRGVEHVEFCLMDAHADTARRARWILLLRAVLVVPWIFVWIVPVVMVLEMRAERATAALAVLGAGFIWWNVVRPLRSRRPVIASLRPRPWRQYVGWLTAAGVAQLALIFATLALHEQLAAWRFLPTLPSGPALVPCHLLGDVLGPVAMFLAVVVIAPLVEEFGCRGRMQYRLERALGVIPGILVPAIIFSLLHGVVIATHHLPFAVFAGWVVWRTGSIWTAVYVHALNNAAVLVLVYLSRDWQITSQDIPPWLWPYAIAAGLIALGALLAAGWRIHRLAQVDRPRGGVVAASLARP